MSRVATASGTGQPVPRDLVPAGPGLRLSGGFQQPARPVATEGQRTAGPADRGLPVGPARRRQSDHAGAAAGSIGHRLNCKDPAPEGLLAWMGSSDYSVHPQAFGRFVDVTADFECVTIGLDSRSVGTRRRSWGADLTPGLRRGGKGAAAGPPNPSSDRRNNRAAELGGLRSGLRCGPR